MRDTGKIEFFRHALGQEEKARVLAALDETILTTGETVGQVERALAEYLNVRHVVCLDSCTAALHLALLADNIGPGDEVIVPAMTFVATANAVVMAGATPVFADVDPQTGCLEPTAIARCVTNHTKAIIPVHLYGLMCDMEALASIAAERDLVLIEDAAHCLEGRRGTARPCSHSNAACFSFYATKAITCGEGGALATNDAAVADRVRKLSQHGMTSSASQRYGRRYEHWDMDELGWKYNLDNIRASLLLPQIRKLDNYCERRRELAARYEQRLREVRGVTFPSVPDDAYSARHLFTIWVDPARRDEIMAALQHRGIGVAVNYRPVHLMKYYRQRFGYTPGDLPAAEAIGAATISLPLYPQLTDEQVDHVVEAVVGAVTGSALTALRPKKREACAVQS